MKILIADDNKISRLTLLNYLKNDGHEIFVADNGNEAYRLWEDENPDILLTDIIMPEMDGIELIHKIRLQPTNKYTFIIVITSHSDENTFNESFEVGADDFIQKPFTQVELKNRLLAGSRIVLLQEKQLVLYALGQIIEARDLETGAHVERVGVFSKILASTLKLENHCKDTLTRAYIDNLELSASLHDIGKIGIPDSILLKPGIYSTDEYNQMKEHANIGYEIIERIRQKYPNAKFLQIAGEVTRYHHEWYNGEGYPFGLKGEEIPLSARIVALADVYDALRSKRVYKEPMTHELAKSEIIRLKGTHFDPLIVNAFLKAEHQFIKTYDTLI